MTIPDTDGKIAEMQSRAARFAQRVEQIRGKGSRLNGKLVFEVDAQKNPVRVTADNGIEQYNADSIAELFQGAVRDACRDVDRQVKEALSEFGEDQQTRELIRDAMGPFYPRESSGTTTPSPAPVSGPDPGEDDYEPPTTWLRSL
ncbi:MAG: YbaB/EbfC family nucleoid-associated protein [Segniliparus sp.]|uniref:YbaB/EbfC family nucleoid-associated protein n=1 Tax=Segniliparus sp. TaxID=2804064 RepID=UPI003F2E5EE8